MYLLLYTSDSTFHEYRYWPKNPKNRDAHIYNLYIQLIYTINMGYRFGIPSHEIGRIHDYKFMKRRITSVRNKKF